MAQVLATHDPEPGVLIAKARALANVPGCTPPIATIGTNKKTARNQNIFISFSG